MTAAPPTSEWCLDQLANLIAREVGDRFLASPILEPTPRFFPDRWTPDCAGARRVALRLMSYAGLEEFDVHLEPFSNADWCPAQLLNSQTAPSSGRHAAALFAGIEGGVCYFGVNDQHIGSPDSLVGSLSHEVAHAWRRTRGIETEDRMIEEYLTDITTVYLGFGVLTCNAAYRYRSRASYYSHESVGYLGPEAFCYLLAVQSKARGEDPRRIRALLEPNQAECFEQAYEDLDDDELMAKLSLPSLDRPRALAEGSPRPLRESLGQIERRIKALAEREGSSIDPKSGLFPAPVRCDFVASQADAKGLLVLGYFGIGVRRWASLELVGVSGFAHQILVMESEGARGVETYAFGMLADAIASKRKPLLGVLKQLFATNGHPDAQLLTELPAYLLWTTKAGLSLGDLKELMWIGAEHLNLDRLEECVEALERYSEDIWARDSIAGRPFPCPVTGRRDIAPSKLTQALLKRWWALASDAGLAEEMAQRVEFLARSRSPRSS